MSANLLIFFQHPPSWLEVEKAIDESIVEMWGEARDDILDVYDSHNQAFGDALFREKFIDEVTGIIQEKLQDLPHPYQYAGEKWYPDKIPPEKIPQKKNL